MIERMSTTSFERSIPEPIKTTAMSQPITARNAPIGTRCGMAVLVVLAFITITVAVSYALVRSQFTAVTIEQNSDAIQRAQDAAWAGASHALRQLHSADWGGTGSSETVHLTSAVQFTVVYRAGDETLPIDDTSYPYRVTVNVTGRVVSTDGSPDTTYPILLVVQLVPRQLSGEPAAWKSMTQRSLTQWNASRTTKIDIPARIEGPVALQGELRLFDGYPAGTNPPVAYANDLKRMAMVEQNDYRPFNGPAGVGPATRGSTGYTYLRDILGVPTYHLSATDTPAFLETNVPTTYRLYPGGPEYAIPALPATLDNAILQADPRTNPLGIYRLAGATELGDDVSIEGVILSSGHRLRFRGTGITVKATELPELADNREIYSLPAIASAGEIRIDSGSSATCQGFVLAQSRFRIEADTGPTVFSLNGSLATAELKIEEDNRWPTSSSWWQAALHMFQMTFLGSGGYFPEFVYEEYGLDPRPQILIKLPSGTNRYHWQNWNEPVFVPHPDDEGLRWSLIRWSSGTAASGGVLN